MYATCLFVATALWITLHYSSSIIYGRFVQLPWLEVVNSAAEIKSIHALLLRQAGTVWQLAQWYPLQKKLTSIFWMSVKSVVRGSNTSQCQNSEAARLLTTNARPNEHWLSTMRTTEAHEDYRELNLSTRPLHFFPWESLFPWKTPRTSTPSLLHYNPAGKTGWFFSTPLARQKTITFFPIIFDRRSLFIQH